MIECSYVHGGGSYALNITGHAGYSQAGNDIVCAGVSAIAFSLIAYVEEHRGEAEYARTEYQSGSFLASVIGNEKMGAAFEMAASGIALIADKYPENAAIMISAAGGDSREQTAGKEHGHHAEKHGNA